MKSQGLENEPLGKTNNNINYEIRAVWENCVKNQVVQPLRYYSPETLEDIIHIINEATENKCRVRSVGSGHSFSEILQTTDFLVNCHGLNNPIELDKEILKPDGILKDLLKGSEEETLQLVHVENGIRIRDLNKYLDSKNLALINMGAYDAQTILGVISTSTHGTGVRLGPIASSVASIILVSESGKIYRIEPTDGITDPEKYKIKFPDNSLKQDDKWFNAVLISMGCMGIVYSVILKVMNSYYLKEERVAAIHETHWEEVKKELIKGDWLKNNRHLEVWINPYKTDGKNNCLVTKRNFFRDDPINLPAGTRARHYLAEFIAKNFEWLTRGIFKLFYKYSPGLINFGMKQVIDYDCYVDKNYEVMNLGNANYIKGFSGEYAISLKNNLFIDAADRIIKLAEKERELGSQYHSAPISLRFVKKCDAYLSMMNGEDKCMIEIPLLVGTRYAFQILQNIENELSKLENVRPHWGHYHQLTGERIRKLYPDTFEKWLDVYCELNKNGMFDNYFTDKCDFRNNIYQTKK